MSARPVAGRARGAAWLAAAAGVALAAAQAIDAPAQGGRVAQADALDLRLPSSAISLVTASIDDTIETVEGTRRITVTLSADALFAFDGARLSPGAEPRFEEVARRIEAADPRRVSVVAHSDTRGDAAANRRATLRRAQVVGRGLRDALSARNLPAIGVTGDGELDPVATGRRLSSRERARNRRVVVSFATGRRPVVPVPSPSPDPFDDLPGFDDDEPVPGPTPDAVP